jgi:hypothetical protein
LVTLPIQLLNHDYFFQSWWLRTKHFLLPLQGAMAEDFGTPMEVLEPLLSNRHWEHVHGSYALELLLLVRSIRNPSVQKLKSSAHRKKRSFNPLSCICTSAVASKWKILLFESSSTDWQMGFKHHLPCVFLFKVCRSTRIACSKCGAHVG